MQGPLAFQLTTFNPQPWPLLIPVSVSCGLCVGLRSLYCDLSLLLIHAVLPLECFSPPGPGKGPPFLQRQSRGRPTTCGNQSCVSYAEVVLPSFCPRCLLVVLQLQCLLQKIMIYLPRCPSSRAGNMSHSSF